MLDLKLWTKLYWENEENHWGNLAKELKEKDPYDYAMEISTRIQKINSDYFKECAQGSLGYYPSVTLDTKYKKLKKSLGAQSKKIDVKNWVNQLNTVSDKAVVFFHYFSHLINFAEGKQVRKMIPHYNEKIVEYLKNEIITGHNEKKDSPIETLQSLNSELQRIAQENTFKNNQFILNFFYAERNEKWFKEHLSDIAIFRVFFYFTAHLIEETQEDIIEWSKKLKEYASEKSLIELNANLLSLMDIFQQKERFFEFTQSLPIEYYAAFKQLIFSDIKTMETLDKWYENVLRNEENEKLFFDKIWLYQERGMRVTTNLDTDSIILNYFASKMSSIYSKEEIQNFNFQKCLIANQNIQEIMSKKISYYYLENKLNPTNKVKTKTLKI